MPLKRRTNQFSALWMHFSADPEEVPTSEVRNFLKKFFFVPLGCFLDLFSLNKSKFRLLKLKITRKFESWLKKKLTITPKSDFSASEAPRMHEKRPRSTSAVYHSKLKLGQIGKKFSCRTHTRAPFYTKTAKLSHRKPNKNVKKPKICKKNIKSPECLPCAHPHGGMLLAAHWLFAHNRHQKYIYNIVEYSYHIFMYGTTIKKRQHNNIKIMLK